jgi:hypothetical protein
MGKFNMSSPKKVIRSIVTTDLTLPLFYPKSGPCAETVFGSPFLLNNLNSCIEQMKNLTNIPIPKRATGR